MGSSQTGAAVPRIKTVFHVHTDHSFDCNRSVEELLDTARRLGIGCITVTDHDTMSGARAMAAAAAAGGDVRVIPGEEISTTHGHLIGLFLREEIAPGMSPRRTAEAIRAQGGLVVVPHPFNRLFGCGICGHIHEIVDLIDAVEVFNAQNLWQVPNRRAERFAEAHGFPQIVGVDLHHGDNLDAACQYLEPFDGPQAFLAALRQATYVKSRHSLSYFARTAGYVLLDRSGIGLPEAFGRNSDRSHDRHAFREAVVPANGD